MVKAAGAKKLSLPTPSEQEAGVAFSVTLTALDNEATSPKATRATRPSPGAG